MSILISSQFDFSRLCERSSCLCFTPILNIHFNNQPSLLEMWFYTFEILNIFNRFLEKVNLNSCSNSTEYSLRIFVRFSLFSIFPCLSLEKGFSLTTQKWKQGKDNEKCTWCLVASERKSDFCFSRSFQGCSNRGVDRRT